MISTVKWLQDAVFYEIYPQSFLDTNGDGIGDIPGITRKLDYIRELGCNAIWLNPCFCSPFADAGYDITDYYQVAPRYGTNEDLKNLFREAHARGMHLLLDLVPGHTSVDHPWFLESMRPERNSYSDRYVWTDSVWESPEGMNCLRGISQRDGACATNFFSIQPALNYGFYRPDKPWQMSMSDEAPRATLEEMKNVMRFWLRMGCDGFRVDMAGSLVKKDPESLGTIALWKEVRAFLDEEFPEAAMISEWSAPVRSLEGGFHMDFLLHSGATHYDDLFRCENPYFSKKGKGDCSAFVEKYKDNYSKTKDKGLICIPSGNHDLERLAWRLDEDELKSAFAFLLSMPGAPFLYYGDEIGMRYLENLTSVEGGYYRTGSRTPMQWDDSVNAGFSSAPAQKLYIQMDPDEDRPTVLKQTADADSLYHEIKKLIAIRKAHPALQSYSDIRFVYSEKNAYPLAYERSAPGEDILVVINPSGREAAISYSAGKLGEVIYRLNGGCSIEKDTVSMKPCSACFIRIKK